MWGAVRRQGCSSGRSERLCSRCARRRRGRRRRTRWRNRSRRRPHARRQRRSLHRRENVVAERDSVIERHALSDEVGIERVGTERVLAHGEGLVRLVALTDLDGRRALAREPHAGGVAGTAHGDRGILRQLAVQPVGCVDRGGVGRASPHRRWQETDGARRGITQTERRSRQGVSPSNCPYCHMMPCSRRTAEATPAVAPATRDR